MVLKQFKEAPIISPQFDSAVFGTEFKLQPFLHTPLHHTPLHTKINFFFFKTAFASSKYRKNVFLQYRTKYCILKRIGIKYGDSLSRSEYRIEHIYQLFKLLKSTEQFFRKLHISG